MVIFDRKRKFDLSEDNFRKLVQSASRRENADQCEGIKLK
jgi:hypothetical protein